MVNNIMHSLHLFLVSLGLGSSMMNITKTSPESSTMVPEGEFLVLSCEADQPWFLCVWTSPLGGKQCAIQVDILKKIDLDTDVVNCHAGRRSSHQLNMPRGPQSTP